MKTLVLKKNRIYKIHMNLIVVSATSGSICHKILNIILYYKIRQISLECIYEMYRNYYVIENAGTSMGECYKTL